MVRPMLLVRIYLDAESPFSVGNIKAKGQAPDSFAKFLIEHKEYELSDNEVAYLAGSMFGAGSDTVCSQLPVIGAHIIFIELSTDGICYQHYVDGHSGFSRGPKESTRRARPCHRSW